MNINSREELDGIDQSVYSRIIIKGEETYTQFFGNHIGQFNSSGEMVDRTDTNMGNASMTINQFELKAIRFKETIMDTAIRNHLLKYAHFIFRLIDKEYIVYPLHLMDNYYYFLERKLEIPIWINSYENFSVVLRDKPFGMKIELTCELRGVLYRRK